MNRVNIMNKDLWKFGKKQDIIPDLQNFLDGEQKTSRVGSSITHFSVLCEVGKGSFGTVYKVQSHQDNQIYAVKKIDLSNVNIKKQKESLNEI